MDGTTINHDILGLKHYLGLMAYSVLYWHMKSRSILFSISIVYPTVLVPVLS